MNRQPRPTNVPAAIVLSEVEQAALDFAREQILLARNNSSPWSASSALSPEASHAMIQSVLALGWGDVMNRLRLIMMARAGLRDAQAALHRIILEYQSRHEPMPAELQAYDMETKTFGIPAQWAGPKRASRMLRDIVIMVTVMAVVDKFALSRTKRSPKHRSACEIVSTALESAGISIGHKGVERIVERYREAWPTVPGWSALAPWRKPSYEN
jgi:hypothetical protein